MYAMAIYALFCNPANSVQLRTTIYSLFQHSMYTHKEDIEEPVVSYYYSVLCVFYLRVHHYMDFICKYINSHRVCDRALSVIQIVKGLPFNNVELYNAIYSSCVCVTLLCHVKIVVVHLYMCTKAVHFTTSSGRKYRKCEIKLQYILNTYYKTTSSNPNRNYPH